MSGIALPGICNAGILHRCVPLRWTWISLPFWYGYLNNDFFNFFGCIFSAHSHKLTSNIIM